jgi:hypothetical protein
MEQHNRRRALQAEARVRVLRSLAAKIPAHRARYEAAPAALKVMIETARS